MNSQKLNIIILTASTIMLCTSFGLTFAQTETSTDIPLPEPVKELKQEVDSTAIQADTNTILTGTGIAGVIYTAAKQILDQRKNKKEDKGTDIDLTRVTAIIGKIFAYAYVIDPYWKKVLDSPVDANPLNSNIKIGHEFAKEMQALIDYTKTVINAPVPNMSIAAPSPLLESVKIPETEKVNTIESDKPVT